MTVNLTSGEIKQIKRSAQWVFKNLLDKYGSPSWREPLPPIDELVSTILSQNTNDNNRDLAFNRLNEKYPDWDQVRSANLENIIDAIRPAGLGNQKGKRIKSILMAIHEQQGKLDLDFLKQKEKEEVRDYLMGFKGVGFKTAAIVMQFSLGIPAFPVDTHIYRITGRFGLRPEKMSVEDTHLLMEKVFSEDQYETGHLNIIRLGREICQARKVMCSICPLQKRCQYFLDHS